MQQAELARLEALCIERRILPLRVYRGAAGNTRHYSRSRCRSVGVVAVVRTVRELQRARTILENWVRARASDPSGPSDQAVRRKIVRFKRIVELKERAREQAVRNLIRCGTTWQTMRLARVRFR